jgi:adenylosuccinate synthase
LTAWLSPWYNIRAVAEPTFAGVGIVPDVHVVVGGQFGSEGKGHFVAQLARRVMAEQDTPFVVRTGGPNAGHCALDDTGRKWKLRHIPTPAVVSPDIPLALAEGCEVDNEVLFSEIGEMERAGIPVLGRLIVDAGATHLADHHRNREADLVERIGSTGKGIGAARSDRIKREADTWGGGNSVIGHVRAWLDSGKPVIIEGTQGYGLGLHAGFYPQCTSRDVRALDVLAEVGLSPWEPNVDRVVVWVVFRPNPIRVAGNSGPLKGETTWEGLGLPEEHTTVTGKVRRVGEWDADLAKAALLNNGGPGRNIRPIMMFADYVNPGLAGLDGKADLSMDLAGFIRFEADLGCTIHGLGTGENTFAWRYAEL